MYWETASYTMYRGFMKVCSYTWSELYLIYFLEKCYLIFHFSACFIIVFYTETFCFKGWNTLFHRKKQFVSITTIPMKQCHLFFEDDIWMSRKKRQKWSLVQKKNNDTVMEIRQPKGELCQLRNSPSKDLSAMGFWISSCDIRCILSSLTKSGRNNHIHNIHCSLVW